MIPALAVALSAQTVLMKRLDTIASNVANASTIGYRGDQVNFEELVSSPRGSAFSFPSTGSSALSTNSGALVKTEGNLDLAIQGDGWFAVDTPAGRSFTRDGRFVVSPEGQLVTVTGARVLDVGGAPITIESNGPPPKVARDGMITQGNAQVGAVGLFRLDHGASFQRLEGALIMSDRPADPIVDFGRNGVQSGFLESSNVSPVVEISRLIAVQRMFSTVSNGVESTENNVEQAIKMLGPSG